MAFDASAVVPKVTNPTDYAGPDPRCHWLLQGQILMGLNPGVAAWTGSLDGLKYLRTIRAAGVTEFVSFLHRDAEEGQKGESSDRSVDKAAARIKAESAEDKAVEKKYQERRQYDTFANFVNNKLDKPANFHPLPLKDFSTGGGVADHVARNEHIIKLLVAGKKIFMSCWSGHGRTGMVACGIIMARYRLTFDEAKAYVCDTHLARATHPKGGCDTCQKFIKTPTHFALPEEARQVKLMSSAEMQKAMWELNDKYFKKA